MQRTGVSNGSDLDEQNDKENDVKENLGKSNTQALNKIVYLQIGIIVLLLINIASTIVLNQEPDIIITQLNVKEGQTDNRIFLELKNIGGAKAKVHVMGEVFYDISDGGQRFIPLTHRSLEIHPGKSSEIHLGETDLDYFTLRLYVNWNGGSIVSSYKMDIYP